MAGFEYWDAGSNSYSRLIEIKTSLAGSWLSKALLELVFLRISQINGCEYYINLHRISAVKEGATQDQIDAVENLRKRTSFSQFERATIEWAECVSTLEDRAQLKAVRDQLMLHLNARELTDLTVAVGLMNALNRLSISLGR